ncbi:MAG: EpsG family protein [Tyzzerella sp.]|uniref:EpsG family protein n=1 Tax=Candidatus Fimicola merdigallinarum TaxID=2840819 RepID=A0A9D9H529_9FIRM|nr:EpsG family protein [Candidatus Fimicola merdigallinarum]
MSSLSLIIFSSLAILSLSLERLLIRKQYIVPDLYQKYINKYNNVLTIAVFLVASLRHPYTGTDTAAYYAQYVNNIDNYVDLKYYWYQIINSLRDGTFRDGFTWEFFNKLLSYIIKDGQLWLAVVSGIFIYAVYITIKRYSNDSVLSWVYIIYMYIFLFVLQGLRQSVAMAIVLLSFKYVKERKIIKFILMILLSTLFHQSSWVFLIVYPLYRFPVNGVCFWIMGGVFLISKVLPSIIVTIFSGLASNSRFLGYLEGRNNMYSSTGFFVLLFIFILCYMNRKYLLTKDEDSKILYTISMLGVATQATASIVAEMFRISYYFSMFNMLLVANTISSIENKRIRKRISYAVIIMFLLYFYVSGIFRYRFFWQ